MDEVEQVMDCFEHINFNGLYPIVVTSICILKFCGSIRGADKGIQMYDEIPKHGVLFDQKYCGCSHKNSRIA